MALRDRLLGDPDRLDEGGLARGARRGSEAWVVRCLAQAGDRGGPPATALLLAYLGDPRAAVRRAAAWGLAARADGEALGRLRVAEAGERTEEGRLALAVARARCGDPAEGVRAALASFDARLVHTATGPRAPAAARATLPLLDRFDLAWGEGASRADLLSRRRAALGGPDPRRALLGLASLRHPADHARLVAQLRAAGRRGEHTALGALGLHGDPRGLPLLHDALVARDVDPGRGFAWRRVAASAIGQIGLADTAGWLLRGLDDEARDYEGRPGAGLGIQYPVRADLLWALGELGAPTAIPALVRHLGDTHGSALGGFHLPAMDALWKLAPASLPALRDAARGPDSTTAVHALGVLAALGQDLGPWTHDPRPELRRWFAEQEER